MTYRQLRDALNGIEDTDTRLDDDVSIVLLDAKESIPAIDFVSQHWGDYTGEEEALGIDIVDGVLDTDHMFLTINF